MASKERNMRTILGNGGGNANIDISSGSVGFPQFPNILTITHIASQYEGLEEMVYVTFLIIDN
jgi:hypothetical protein